MRQCKVEFTAKYGKFTEVSVDYNRHVDEQVKPPLLNVLSYNYKGPVNEEGIKSALLSKELHKIADWEEVLPPFLSTYTEQDVPTSPGKALNQLFGVGNYESLAYIRL